MQARNLQTALAIAASMSGAGNLHQAAIRVGRKAKKPGCRQPIQAPSQEEAEKFCWEEDAKRAAFVAPAYRQAVFGTPEEDRAAAIDNSRRLIVQRRKAVKRQPRIGLDGQPWPYPTYAGFGVSPLTDEQKRARDERRAKKKQTT